MIPSNTIPGWSMNTLGTLAEVIMGQSPDSKYVNDLENGVKFIQGNAEFTDKHPQAIHWVTFPTKLSQVEDILISIRAPVGEMNISDQEYCIGRGLAAVRAKSFLDKYFLWYSIQIHKSQLNRYAQGSTFLAVNSSDLKNIEICFPEKIPEQQKIAEILSTLDDLISHTESLIQKYLKIKRGFLQDLLSRGIDEFGNIRPPLNDAQGLYYSTQFGFIPKHWVIISLVSALGKTNSNIVAGPFGSNLKVSDYQETGVPILRLQNIDENEFLYKEIKYISEEKAKKLSYHSFVGGDLVLAKLGDPVGKTCIVPSTLTKGIVVSDVVRIRVDPSLCDKIFIMYILNSVICRKQLYLNIIGTTRPRVNLSQIRNLQIPFPPIEEQKRIADTLFSVDQSITLLRIQNNKNMLLKQGLMHDLLTGKVRVKTLL